MQERYKARYEEWTQPQAEWRASGLSGAAFCRERGLAYWKFLSWKQGLGRLTSAGSEADANGFLALKLEDEPDETCGVSVSIGGRIRLGSHRPELYSISQDLLKTVSGTINFSTFVVVDPAIKCALGHGHQAHENP